MKKTLGIDIVELLEEVWKKASKETGTCNYFGYKITEEDLLIWAVECALRHLAGESGCMVDANIKQLVDDLSRQCGSGSLSVIVVTEDCAHVKLKNYDWWFFRKWVQCWPGAMPEMNLHVGFGKEKDSLRFCPVFYPGSSFLLIDELLPLLFEVAESGMQWKLDKIAKK